MKLRKLLFGAIIFAICVSCNNSSETSSELIDLDTTKVELEQDAELLEEVDDESIDDEEGYNTFISFGEFAISINHFLAYNEEEEVEQSYEDTAYIYTELGETIEGQLIFVYADDLENISIKQRYETSFTIMNKGPHCDLIDWRHYISKWVELQNDADGNFICVTYNEKEYSMYPKATLEELKTEVKKKCGEEWANLLKDVNSKSDYPIGASISRYFLSISAIEKATGQALNRLVIIEVPMGC